MVEMGEVIKAIQDVVGAVTGIRSAPDGVPDSLGPFPASIVYPVSGYFNGGRMLENGKHNIAIEIHVTALKDLLRDTVAAYPYWKSIPEALMTDPTLAKHIEYPTRITYTFGRMEYNSVATIGWRFTLENVEIHKYKK